MQSLSPELAAIFDRWLSQARVAEAQRPDYHKWVTSAITPTGP
jgi:hypothetical protein